MVQRKTILQLIKYRSRFVFLVLLLFCKCLLAQNVTADSSIYLIIDSLGLVLKNETQDTVKVKVLNNLAEEYLDMSWMISKANLEPATKYAKEALFLAEKLNNKQQQGLALNTIAGVLKIKGDLPEAIKIMFIVLKIAEETGDKALFAELIFSF